MQSSAWLQGLNLISQNFPFQAQTNLSAIEPFWFLLFFQLSKSGFPGGLPALRKRIGFILKPIFAFGAYLPSITVTSTFWLTETISFGSVDKSICQSGFKWTNPSWWTPTSTKAPKAVIIAWSLQVASSDFQIRHTIHTFLKSKKTSKWLFGSLLAFRPIRPRFLIVGKAVQVETYLLQNWFDSSMSSEPIKFATLHLTSLAIWATNSLALRMGLQEPIEFNCLACANS